MRKIMKATLDQKEIEAAIRNFVSSQDIEISDDAPVSLYASTSGAFEASITIDSSLPAADSSAAKTPKQEPKKKRGRPKKVETVEPETEKQEASEEETAVDDSEEPQETKLEVVADSEPEEKEEEETTAEKPVLTKPLTGSIFNFNNK